MKLQIFDVEHGACALLTCDNNTRMMIDCGHNATTEWKPGNHLSSLGVGVLDMLMITNYDEDHVSGIRNLEEKVFVRWLVRNKSVDGSALLSLKSESGAGPNIKHLSQLMSAFTQTTAQASLPVFPNVTWAVFNNFYPAFKDENNLSMVVSLTINGINFLFPGDLEKQGWLTLLATNTAFWDAVKKTDVLIASHHGRQNGVSEEIFDRVGCNPVTVVISDDYHQYDTQKTAQYYGSKAKGFLLGNENRRVLTTRCDGEIDFDFAGRPYGWAWCSVHPSRPMKPLPALPLLPRLAGLPNYSAFSEPQSLARLWAGIPEVR